MPSLSIVIPTRDRGATLAETLDACLRQGDGLELEIIVVDLGSTDDTPARLEALSAKDTRVAWRRLDGAVSPAAARNLGAALARHEVVLFLADTLRPADPAAFTAHLEVHERFPAAGTAVLGAIGWAERPGLARDLAEPAAAEAGGGDLTPYAWHDWRALRSRNLSVKRALLADWTAEGFAPDFAPTLDGPALDGVELGWRLHGRGVAVRVFHTTAARVLDAGGWSLDRLMRRHADAAVLARALVERHGAALRDGLGLAGLDAALAGRDGAGRGAAADAGTVADYLAMIEGVKALTRLQDARGAAPGEALWAALALCAAQGHLLTAPAGADLAAGGRFALEAYRQRLNRAVQGAVTGLPAAGGGEGAPVATWRPPRPGPLGRLRAWARRKPALVRIYLWLRAAQGR